MAILAASQLIKSYNKRNVVDGVCYMSYQRSRWLLGPNGAGKTTSFLYDGWPDKADQARSPWTHKILPHYPMHLRAAHGIGLFYHRNHRFFVN